MDKKSLVRRVARKIQVKDVLNTVSKNINKPVILVEYFGKDFKKGLSLDDVVEIFSAIEKAGYIQPNNPTNMSTWKRIYDNLGIVYPVSVEEE